MAEALRLKRFSWKWRPVLHTNTRNDIFSFLLLFLASPKVFCRCNCGFLFSFIYLQALPNRRETLIISSWPQTSLPKSTDLVKRFENLQALEEKEVLALLSKLDLDNIHFADSPPEDAKQSVHLIASEGLEAYLPLTDMVDISAEVQRLTKRLSKMQTEYEGLKARLNSPKFIEKAPKDVVRGVQDKAAEAEEKINLTKNRLAFLKSTVMLSQ
ncbi:hypothetical protein ES319_D12G000800v1 [Gossypium barbadense]|uniref:valine--tRNA ligase n=1 Tax=Gossypium barbadense TaxID=3634 RepID=A0A5J5NSQ0_GOSBA|nr:hypothetical protein ES319_D12G000800v1 [Gossypium barbadense]